MSAWLQRPNYGKLEPGMVVTKNTFLDLRESREDESEPMKQRYATCPESPLDWAESSTLPDGSPMTDVHSSLSSSSDTPNTLELSAMRARQTSTSESEVPTETEQTMDTPRMTGMFGTLEHYPEYEPKKTSPPNVDSDISSDTRAKTDKTDIGIQARRDSSCSTEPPRQRRNSLMQTQEQWVDYTPRPSETSPTDSAAAWPGQAMPAPAMPLMPPFPLPYPTMPIAMVPPMVPFVHPYAVPWAPTLAPFIQAQAAMGALGVLPPVLPPVGPTMLVPPQLAPAVSAEAPEAAEYAEGEWQEATPLESETVEESGKRDRNPRPCRKLRLWAHIYLHMQQEGFDLVPRLIGRKGCNMRKIADLTGAKIRIRGRGSGHLEVDGKYEAPTPLMVAVTTNLEDPDKFRQAMQMTLKELKSVEGRFKSFCTQNSIEHDGPCYSVGVLQENAQEALGDLMACIPKLLIR
ncbi:unnamed protein product [Durusdinium trenchii]|uniref:K Homology domain-containing protein n=1 Tax=Durusdinium trenchii TaxID=1381693 RepID=A0ABP0L7B0_9DINO